MALWEWCFPLELNDVTNIHSGGGKKWQQHFWPLANILSFSFVLHFSVNDRNHSSLPPELCTAKAIVWGKHLHKKRELLHIKAPKWVNKFAFRLNLPKTFRYSFFGNCRKIEANELFYFKRRVIIRRSIDFSFL